MGSSHIQLEWIAGVEALRVSIKLSDLSSTWAGKVRRTEKPEIREFLGTPATANPRPPTRKGRPSAWDALNIRKISPKYFYCVFGGIQWRPGVLLRL